RLCPHAVEGRRAQREQGPLDQPSVYQVGLGQVLDRRRSRFRPHLPGLTPRAGYTQLAAPTARGPSQVQAPPSREFITPICMRVTIGGGPRRGIRQTSGLGAHWETRTVVMLARLSIRDIVLIDRLDIDFASGLSALTGETGAGKSIVLDAFALALGA